MAEIVWCQSCKTVVWAYDHQPKVDMRGIVNMLDLYCPRCEKRRSFDGWGSDNLEEVDEALRKTNPEIEIYDWWSAMRAIAHIHNVDWKPSPDNRWV